LPNWQGSTRKDTLPPNWEKVIRPRILARDHHQCQHIRSDRNRICGARANQVDHIDQERRDDHSDANLQSLCQWHHQRKSSAEGGRGNRRKEPARRHPGLLA
jgi:5-methylcytosine-specific restriction endonuclease McrA